MKSGFALDDFNTMVELLSWSKLTGNWLQVSSFTKLSEIDQSEGPQFESMMTFLLGLKT
jgi:hypothetical protein